MTGTFFIVETKIPSFIVKNIDNKTWRCYIINTKKTCQKDKVAWKGEML